MVTTDTLKVGQVVRWLAPLSLGLATKGGTQTQEVEIATFLLCRKEALLWTLRRAPQPIPHLEGCPAGLDVIQSKCR